MTVQFLPSFGKVHQRSFLKICHSTPPQYTDHKPHSTQERANRLLLGMSTNQRIYTNLINVVCGNMPCASVV